MSGKPIPFEQRFPNLVDIRGPDECWPWLGGGGKYGATSINGKQIGAHVATYITFVGEVPSGQLVRHTCDFGFCCNPAHLIPGTQADNRRDAVERGRGACGERINTAKITAEIARRIRRDLASGRTVTEIASELGLSSKIVYRIRWGETWRHVT